MRRIFIYNLKSNYLLALEDTQLNFASWKNTFEYYDDASHGRKAYGLILGLIVKPP